MRLSSQRLSVDDIPVEIVRKNIKHIHIRIFPPEGHVRITVPSHITHEQLRLAIISRLSWIRKKQAMFRQQPKQQLVGYLSGESHYFLGNPYTLNVVVRHGRHSVAIMNDSTMVLQVSPGTTRSNRALVVHDWYRQQLKTVIPGLLAKWQPIIGKQVSAWGVKRMKTRWGSCNVTQARIWLSLELAKKPLECLEYVVVHELVHFHERHHNSHFYRLMDAYLPHWRRCNDILNNQIPAHEKLGC